MGCNITCDKLSSEATALDQETLMPLPKLENPELS
jgi:hypothetical protein